MNETAKTRSITAPFLQGNVLDLGSGGDIVVPWAIQIDLHRHWRDGHPPVQFVGDVFQPLPFKDAAFDAVFASHVLEDTLDWMPVLKEWVRVVKVGGHILIQVPDHVRYRAAVAAGQPDNLAHKHESCPGELTEHFSSINGLGQFKILMDRFEPAGCYNILFIAQKL